MYRFFILALLVFSFCTPFEALAQNRSRPGGADTDFTEKPRYYRGLVPRDSYSTMLFQDPSEPENIFYLRVMNNGEVSGCFEITKARSEIKNNAQYINLSVTDQEIYVKRRGAERYTNYDCKNRKASPLIDVRLDRDEMIEQGVKKIALKSKKYGDFSEAEVKISEEKIEIITVTPDGSYADVLWFFPNNTIILHAPQAKQGSKGVLEKLRAYGVAQGFIPMENVLKGYYPPATAENYVVFTDPTGAVRRQLNSPRDNLPIGHIKPTRTMHGPQGQYDAPYELEVFATLHGRVVIENEGASVDEVADDDAKTEDLSANKPPIEFKSDD